MLESKTIAAMLKKFTLVVLSGLKKIIDQSMQSGILTGTKPSHFRTLTGFKTLSEFDAGK